MSIFLCLPSLSCCLPSSLQLPMLRCSLLFLFVLKIGPTQNSVHRQFLPPHPRHATAAAMHTACRDGLIAMCCRLQLCISHTKCSAEQLFTVVRVWSHLDLMDLAPGPEA